MSTRHCHYHKSYSKPFYLRSILRNPGDENKSLGSNGHVSGVNEIQIPRLINSFIFTKGIVVILQLCFCEGYDCCVNILAH